jgi:hypothetical protein
VDWILFDFLDRVEHKQMGRYQAVNHIGTISSRIGRIDNISPGDSVAAQEIKSREIPMDTTQSTLPDAEKTENESPDPHSTSSPEYMADTKMDESPIGQSPDSTAFGDAKNGDAFDSWPGPYPTNTSETTADEVDDLLKQHPSTSPPENATMIRIGVYQPVNTMTDIVVKNGDSVGKSPVVRRPAHTFLQTNADEEKKLQQTMYPSESTTSNGEDLPADRQPINPPANTTMKIDASIGDEVGNSTVRNRTNTSQTNSDKVDELQQSADPTDSTASKGEDLPADRKPINPPASTTIEIDASINDAVVLGNSPVRRPSN